MLTADGEAGDTPLRFFTQNTMPLCRLGLFFHNLWETYGQPDLSPEGDRFPKGGGGFMAMFMPLV